MPAARMLQRGFFPGFTIDHILLLFSSFFLSLDISEQSSAQLVDRYV